MRRLFKCSVVCVTAVSVVAGPLLAATVESGKIVPTQVAEKNAAEAAVSLKVTGMT